MPSTATNRLQGLTTSVAVKPPCITVATTNITLSGLQTISGVTVVEDDRVLVKGQSTASENGIYNASTGSWTRAKDFDGVLDAVSGTRILIRRPGSSLAAEYELTSADPIVIGTTELTFSLRYGANATYDTTEGEIAASASVVNSNYPIGWVDRYGTNTIPGTTDMSAAFNAAYAVAKQTRCTVVYGATAPYRLNSPINCTQTRGVVTNDESGMNATDGNAAIIIAHTGHGFDLSASTDFEFNAMTAKSLAGTVPNTLFFVARPVSGAGAGGHRFNNIHTTSACTFRHVWYTYGSEENNYNDCFIYNSQPGSSLFNHNVSNPAGFSSSFMTIATGAQSNTTHRHRGGTYYQLGDSGLQNEVVFSLEGASNFTFRDGLWFCPEGLAYVSVSGTSSTNFLTVDSIRGEPGGSTPTYGIYATANAVQLNWTLINAHFQCSQEALYFGDDAEAQFITVLGSSNGSTGKLVNAYDISRSLIQHSANTCVFRTGGTAANNTFIGSRSALTFSGTDTLNTGFDQALGEYWATNDRYTAASTACTGALTTAVVWKVVKAGQLVTLTLPSTVGTTSAAASFTYGVALPAQYRPAADIRQPCVIQDNGASLNQAGFIEIAASTGVIKVYKDIVGTGNWSAAAGGGTPAASSVSWRL